MKTRHPRVGKENHVACPTARLLHGEGVAEDFPWAELSANLNQQVHFLSYPCTNNGGSLLDWGSLTRRFLIFGKSPSLSAFQSMFVCAFYRHRRTRRPV